MKKGRNVVGDNLTGVASTVITTHIHLTGLEISQNKICGGECDSCKFCLNKNTLLFSIDVIGSYFRP